MKKTTFHAIAGLLALGLAFGASFAQAQAGTLDTTFGTGGIVTANFGVTAMTLTAFEQSNGNIAVVAGLNKTGSPDVEGLSIEQTARVLNLSQAAVKARLWRVRLVLRARHFVQSPLSTSIQLGIKESICSKVCFNRCICWSFLELPC
jgi:hypothetical protein